MNPRGLRRAQNREWQAIYAFITLREHQPATPCHAYAKIDGPLDGHAKMGAAATSRRAERTSVVRFLARSWRIGRRRPFSKLRRIRGAPHSGGARVRAGSLTENGRASDLDRGGDSGGDPARKGLKRADRAPGGGALATRSSRAVSASRRRCSEAASARRSSRQSGSWPSSTFRLSRHVDISALSSDQ